MLNKTCSNCGEAKGYNHISPIDSELQSTWGISKAMTKVFNKREGSLCKSCGASIRAQALASAILKSKHGYGQKSLKEWVKIANKKGLKVCEINSCHALHETLKELDQLTYAEFGTPTEQNIEQMTYKNNTFDLVLHSETLEHVSRPQLAMDECRRIIKKQGEVIFSVPIIWAKKSRRRAKIEKDKIEYILKPSYHGKRTDDYLVFFEYGSDADDIFKSDVVYTEPLAQNYIFSSHKKISKISKIRKRKYKLQEKLVEIFATINT